MYASVKKITSPQRIKNGVKKLEIKWASHKISLRVTTGSIGVNESRFECEYTVESLEQLQKMWEDMSTMEAHQQFGKDLEPIIVSGSNRWEIFRVVDF